MCVHAWVYTLCMSVHVCVGLYMGAHHIHTCAHFGEPVQSPPSRGVGGQRCPLQVMKVKLKADFSDHTFVFRSKAKALI